ncbi:MAG TPA: hypothetical protein PKC21_04320 [Oligoflexia bacterium]|nr:hypothetical protein [Oligoflexia bacterium]HMR24564.1 hypothetical protein [Oligoflexia bacterium]
MSQLSYEKKDVSVGKIALYSFLPVVFLVLSIIGVHYYLQRAQFKASLMVNQADRSEIDNMRIDANRQLRSYIKNDDGTFIIPIDRAIEIYTAE